MKFYNLTKYFTAKKCKNQNIEIKFRYKNQKYYNMLRKKKTIKNNCKK